MDSSVRREPDATVVVVTGELDILTAAKFGPELDSIVRLHQGDVFIDIRQAVFIDSAGLFLLLNTQRRLIRRSRRLALVCGDGAVRRAIELARLTETLGVVSTLPADEGDSP